ncbi:hypothetical protein [Bradyrhizobium sp. ORS 86]
MQYRRQGGAACPANWRVACLWPAGETASAQASG